MGSKRDSYHHGDLRETLIQGALELIEEKGVEALSLRAVARAAGVSPGAPYHHFKNRGEILAAVASQGFVLMHEAMADAKAKADQEDSTKCLCVMGEAYATFATKHPGHFRVMFRPELSDRKAFPELDAVARPVFEELANTVIAAQTDGNIPTGDPRRFILLSWAVAHGISSLMVDGPLGVHFEKLDLNPSDLGEIVSTTLGTLFNATSLAEERGIVEMDKEPLRPFRIQDADE